MLADAEPVHEGGRGFSANRPDKLVGDEQAGSAPGIDGAAPRPRDAAVVNRRDDAFGIAVEALHAIPAPNGGRGVGADEGRGVVHGVGVNGLPTTWRWG